LKHAPRHVPHVETRAEFLLADPKSAQAENKCSEFSNVLSVVMVRDDARPFHRPRVRRAAIVDDLTTDD
jgi:hypothetical protein